MWKPHINKSYKGFQLIKVEIVINSVQFYSLYENFTSVWIVRDSNDMRLSPFFVAIFVASVTFGLSKSANAQVSENSVDTDLIFVLINSKTQFY